MVALVFAYMFVYRRFFHAKSVVNSAIYHQALTLIKQNQSIARHLGSSIQIMNCNGKIHPLKSNVNFDLLAFGSQQRGKIHLETEYIKDK